MHDFSSRQSVRDYLRSQGLAAKKRFGQHFLVDPEVLTVILAAASLKPNDRVLEIGPGLGVLTSALATSLPDGLVLALEKDRDLIDHLRTMFKSRKQVKVVAGDVLATPLSELLQTPYKVVANIPYAVTSPIVTKFLLGDYRGRAGEDSPRPESMTLLVQREVAERLAAEAGNRNRGILTVLIELFGKARVVQTVPPEAFEPPPAVESAVLHIEVAEPKANPLTFHRVLKAGFANKRRQLHNSLAGSLHLPPSTVEAMLERVHISSLLRAEQLTLDQWLALHERIIAEVYHAE